MVGLCLGPWDSLRGGAFSYERGIPVHIRLQPALYQGVPISLSFPLRSEAAFGGCTERASDSMPGKAAPAIAVVRSASAVKPIRHI